MGVSETNGQRSRSGLASTLALTLSVVVVVCGVARFLVEGMPASDRCGTTLSLIKLVLSWSILVSSILAMFAGIVALLLGSGRFAWAVSGIVGGAVVLTATLRTASGCGYSVA